MIRFFNAYFPTRTVLLGASEAVLTTAAFVLAIIAAMGPFNAQMFIGYEQGGDRIALVVCVFIMCMYYFDLYDSTVLRSQREVFTRLIQVFGAVCIILSLVYSLFPAMRLQQNVFGAGALAAASVTVLWRRLFSLVSTWPLFMERVLVLGDGVLAQDLLKEIHDRRELGIQVVAHISEDQDWSSWQRPGMPAFAAEIDRVTRVLRVRRIIVSMKERRGRLPVESLLALKKRGVMIQDGSELYQIITGKISLDSLLPSMLVFSPGFQVSRLFLLYKRTFSLVFSAVALLLTFPLMLLLAVVIRLDSTGPVIFRQRRIGKDGKIFTLYKFRSMYEGVDGGRPAAKDDARCAHRGSTSCHSCGTSSAATCTWSVRARSCPSRSRNWPKRFLSTACAGACGREPRAGRKSIADIVRPSRRTPKSWLTTCSTSRIFRSAWICWSSSKPSRYSCSAGVPDDSLGGIRFLVVAAWNSVRIFWLPLAVVRLLRVVTDVARPALPDEPPRPPPRRAAGGRASGVVDADRRL
jgi:hypothetical protein